jgi:hypothetical protein
MMAVFDLAAHRSSERYGGEKLPVSRIKDDAEQRENCIVYMYM